MTFQEIFYLIVAPILDRRLGCHTHLWNWTNQRSSRPNLVYPGFWEDFNVIFCNKKRLICTIGINQLYKNMHGQTLKICWTIHLSCSCRLNLKLILAIKKPNLHYQYWKKNFTENPKWYVESHCHAFEE